MLAKQGEDIQLSDSINAVSGDPTLSASDSVALYRPETALHVLRLKIAKCGIQFSSFQEQSLTPPKSMQI
jgi:hypothetical protein